MSHELIITRDVDLPAEVIYKAWTSPELLVKWFCPRPWRVTRTELDARPGGKFNATMCGPNGEEVAHLGIYLEATPNRRIAFTNLFSEGWEPLQPAGEACSSFSFVAIVTLEELGANRTRYTAVVRHWNEEDARKHEAMGFHEGWNKALDQLIEVMSCS